MSLIITYYPRAAPLCFVLDTQAVIGMNTNDTRVWYTARADYGSAGAPCFDSSLNVVAVHHYAVRSSESTAEFRQGIPIAAIRDRLVRVGKADALGGDPP
jgi:hypothetical protein